VTLAPGHQECNGCAESLIYSPTVQRLVAPTADTNSQLLNNDVTRNSASTTCRSVQPAARCLPAFLQGQDPFATVVTARPNVASLPRTPMPTFVERGSMLHTRHAFLSASSTRSFGQRMGRGRMRNNRKSTKGELQVRRQIVHRSGQVLAVQLSPANSIDSASPLRLITDHSRTYIVLTFVRSGSDSGSDQGSNRGSPEGTIDAMTSSASLTKTERRRASTGHPRATSHSDFRHSAPIWREDQRERRDP
jgi:hypothetical protein